MPVLFVGHGSPMNAIEHNPITAKWELVGETLPKQRHFGCRAVGAKPGGRVPHQETVSRHPAKCPAGGIGGRNT